MCGRFTQMYTWPELVDLYDLADPPASNLEPRYNIAPTEAVDVIVPRPEGGLGMTSMRWWLVPWWWKKPLKAVPPAFNARVEGIDTQPMWRDAWQRGRCLVPASGFYEWSGPKHDRRPQYITGKDGGVLTFAGLYDRWRNPETGERITGCAIIVGPANRWMASLHDRMPMILEKHDFPSWLAGPRLGLLRPAPEDRLRRWPVSKKVNGSLYKEADCVAPLAATDDRGGLPENP